MGQVEGHPSDCTGGRGQKQACCSCESNTLINNTTKINCILTTVNLLLPCLPDTRNMESCAGRHLRAFSSKLYKSLMNNSVRLYTLGLFQICTCRKCVPHSLKPHMTVGFTRGAVCSEDGCTSFRVSVLVHYQCINSGVTATVESTP